MKYILFSFIILGLIFGSSVIAAGNDGLLDETGQAITVEDLGESDSRILPTSNFYFLKEFGRGIQRAFTFDSVKKAELELKFTNQKAAELVQVEKSGGNNIDGIMKAADNYQAAVKRLTLKLDGISDTSENPNVNRLLDSLTERVIRHQQVFEEIKEKHKEVRQRFELVQDDIDEAVRPISKKFDNPERFKKRLENATEKQKESFLKPLQSLKTINRWEDIADSDEFRDKLIEIKDDLVVKFEGKVKANDVSSSELSDILDELEGDEFIRLEIFEDIKERATDIEFKTSLNKLRPRFIEKVELSDNLDVESIDDVINKVEDMIKGFEEKVKKNDVVFGAGAQQLVIESKAKLAEAKQLYEQQQYGEAFGQINSSRVLIENAMRNIYKRDKDFSDNKNGLKNRLDRLENAIEEKGFREEDYPKIDSLFTKSERAIDNISSKEDARIANKLLSELEAVVDRVLNGTSLPRSIRPLSKDKDSTACTLEYDPVCGIDGKTYSNECNAKVAGIDIASEGQCQKIDDNKEDENTSTIKIQDFGSKLLRPLKLDAVEVTK